MNTGICVALMKVRSREDGTGQDGMEWNGMG